MAGKHAKLAPSFSKTWLKCTAAPAYIQRLREDGEIPRDEETIYSIQGTEAHKWGEKVLRGKTTTGKVPDEFRPWVKLWVDHCRSISKGGFVETKVKLFYSPRETGTVDFAAFSDDTLFISDYKHGAGVPVDAVDDEGNGNSQLAIYAIGMVDYLHDIFDITPDTKVVIQIYQPRYGGDPLKTWETTVRHLNKLRKQWDPIAKKILAGDPGEFVAEVDGTCRFCPARKKCLHKAKQALKPVMNDDLSDLLPIVKECLSDEQMLAIFSVADQIKDVVSQVEKELFRRAINQKRVEGTKLVTGRKGDREWGDPRKAEEEIIELFGDGEEARIAAREAGILNPPTPETIKSVSAVEKAVMKAEIVKPKERKKIFEGLTIRSEGKAKLALESDPRPDWDPAQGFDILPELDGDDSED